MSRNQRIRLFNAARYFEQALRKENVDNDQLLTEMGSLRYEIDSAYRALATRAGQPVQHVGITR